jgi:hypothetical protein
MFPFVSNNKLFGLGVSTALTLKASTTVESSLRTNRRNPPSSRVSKNHRDLVSQQEMYFKRKS